MNYTCSICHHDNSPHRLHCEACGTVPSQYSILGKPSILNRYNQDIEVVTARGAKRLEENRGRKLYFRTVPVDYFA